MSEDRGTTTDAHRTTTDHLRTTTEGRGTTLKDLGAPTTVGALGLPPERIYNANRCIRRAAMAIAKRITE